MTTHVDLSRSLGKLEGEYSGMQNRMEKLESVVEKGFSDIQKGLDKINSRLDQIDANDNERKGAWKVIATVSGIVSAVVAFLMKVAMH